MKSYGGWTNAMHSLGIKPWDANAPEEGKKILQALAEDDEEEDKNK